MNESKQDFLDTLFNAYVQGDTTMVNHLTSHLDDEKKAKIMTLLEQEKDRLAREVAGKQRDLTLIPVQSPDKPAGLDIPGTYEAIVEMLEDMTPEGVSEFFPDVPVKVIREIDRIENEEEDDGGDLADELPDEQKPIDFMARKKTILGVLKKETDSLGTEDRNRLIAELVSINTLIVLQNPNLRPADKAKLREHGDTAITANETGFSTTTIRNIKKRYLDEMNRKYFPQEEKG